MTASSCATAPTRPMTACPARRARSRSARSGWCRPWSRSARLHRARRLCEKLLSYASPLGLYGEELDPDTGRHLGNFPQAFTHLALINAVMHLIHAERRHGGVAPTPLPPACGAASDGAGRHGWHGNGRVPSRRGPSRRAATATISPRRAGRAPRPPSRPPACAPRPADHGPADGPARRVCRPAPAAGRRGRSVTTTSESPANGPSSISSSHSCGAPS